MRQDFRWLGFALSAVVHAGLVLGLVLPGASGDPAVTDAEPPPLVIELALFESEQPAVVAEHVPAPSPSPPPQPQPEPEPEPQPEPEPEPEPASPPRPQAIPELQSRSTRESPVNAAARPAVPAAEPRPVPRANLPAPTRVESNEPQPAASVPPVAAAPAPERVDPDRVASIERDYLSRLAALIERHRFYPRASRRLREEGTVVVRLVLAPDGAFSELTLADSSGLERLDRAALETLHKVARFDPIPVLLGRERWRIEVPLVYRLR